MADHEGRDPIVGCQIVNLIFSDHRPRKVTLQRSWGGEKLGGKGAIHLLPVGSQSRHRRKAARIGRQVLEERATECELPRICPILLDENGHQTVTNRDTLGRIVHESAASGLPGARILLVAEPTRTSVSKPCFIRGAKDTAKRQTSTLRNAPSETGLARSELLSYVHGTPVA